MKTKLKLQLLIAMLLSLSGYAHAQGTAIGYQGRLNDGARPATGLYDFNFGVFGLDAGGGPLASNVVRNLVPVTNGVFNVSLDFGAGVFTGAARWLEISVRTNGAGALVILAPRTPLLPTPYAIFAGSAGGVANGTVTANQLNTSLAPTPGQFLSYNGGNLIWTAPGVAVGNIWSALNGSAYYNAGNVGVGTTIPATKLTVLTTPNNYGFEHTDGTIRMGTFLGGSAGGGWLGTRSNHKLNFYVNDGSSSMTVDTNGNVGIGTLTPKHRLSIAGGPGWTAQGWAGAVEFGNGSALGWQANAAGQRFGMGHSDTGFYLFRTASNPGTTTNAANYDLVVNDVGRVGIGTTTPGFKLEVVSDNSTAIVGRSTFIGGAGVYGESSQFNGVRGVGNNTAHGAIVGVHNNGGIAVYGTTSGTGVQGDSTSAGGYGGYFRNTAGGIALCAQGIARVGVLQITGGADLAEPFQMSHDRIAKGSVVIIDEENPGQLKLSDQAYDQRVAGIVSGANGVNPGISLQQEGVLEGGQNVSLSGRVYVQADAAHGSIKPGDLLTTSDTPGHAMKVTDQGRSQGAILGKAMSALKEGKGMVLVLVTLQ